MVFINHIHPSTEETSYGGEKGGPHSPSYGGEVDHFCQKYEINYIHPSTETSYWGEMGDRIPLIRRGNGPLLSEMWYLLTTFNLVRENIVRRGTNFTLPWKENGSIQLSTETSYGGVPIPSGNKTTSDWNMVINNHIHPSTEKPIVRRGSGGLSTGKTSYGGYHIHPP